MALYEKTEALTQIPWYYIAAIDQYERSAQKESDEEQTISIDIADDLWFGIGNSTKNMDEEIITFFDGIGKDGNGDGKADRDAHEDAFCTMASMQLTSGQREDDINI